MFRQSALYTWEIVFILAPMQKKNRKYKKKEQKQKT